MTLLDQLPHLDRGLGAASVVEGIHELLDLNTDEPVAAGEYAGLVRDCERAISRIHSLKLGFVAAADKARVPQASGAASASDWLATTTNTEPAESYRQATLATDLCEELLAGTRKSLADGAVSEKHARVIADAIKRLPSDLPPEQVAAVEAALVQKATVMNPKLLHAAARRAVEAIERDRKKVDAAEDAQLRDEEEAARARTRCDVHDNGDGTMRITATVPTLAGAILKKILDQMSAPRRGRLGATTDQVGVTGNPHAEGFDWARRRGEALVSLIEHLPTDHLAGKVAASVIVKLDHDALIDGLQAAGLDTGDVISAAEARRLSCNAGLVPAVLGGKSQLLDLGRSHRFFTEAQRTAGALTHRTCAADGCEVPYSWCEAHHQVPWRHGGRTDHRDLVPLCGFHHQRIHDPGYDHRYRPGGGVTFARRR